MDLQKIKNRINCLDYAARFGITVTCSGGRTTSLDGGDNKTALVIYEDYWYDFKLAQGGDVIDLCAVHKHDGDRGQAIAELGKLAGLENEPREWKKYTQNLGNLCQKWHEALRDEDRAYINKRGITNETIERLKIGYTAKGFKAQTKDGYVISNYAHDRISIPWWKNDYISGWIARATIPGDEHKYLKPINDDTKDYSAVFGLHTIGKNTDTLVIAEGAFDALSFEQEGYSVLATMGGHFSKEQMKIVLSICKQFKTVFLCFDSDAAGTQFTMRLSKDLFSHKIPFVVGELTARYKDVSEYYEGGNDLKELIANAKNGLLGLCERITDKEELKEFAYKAARFVGKPELAELFNAVKGNDFPSDWLAEVKKSAMASPSEDSIAKDISAKYTLKYNEALGFFEYSRGVWKRKNDKEICAYISSEMGRYRTGGKVSSVLNLVKSDCITTASFNQGNVFNFINGTLELDTLNFREHRESDNCSMQVSYSYDPHARSAEWETFIEQICNSDPKRIELLQQIAGYGLYSDCSLQRCFFLLGDGANGKSVYLDIIKEVFGEDNVSSVEMSGLMEAFQRIQLLTSLFNICTETKTDVKGAESIFKQAVVGDTINGCYKNKDFINFKSRAKWVLACNEMINARDMTYGFERRVCFVKFEVKFVDAPTAPNELKRDSDITGKLRKNLPAVFNWALEGYKGLRIFKEFTATDDEEGLLQTFRETINPIVVFVGEVDAFNGSNKITNADLYAEYRNWCIQCGHQAKAQTGFIRAYKQNLPKGVIEFRTNKERGFEMQSVTSEVSLENQQMKMVTH